MDNKPLLVGVAALAALGLASLFFYLKKSYNTDSISVKLTVQQAREMLQEVKYQMLIVCVNFADKMNEQFIKMIPKNQMDAAIRKLKNNLMQMYQQKEEITLNKYAISKEDFAVMLENFQAYEFVSKYREEIRTMMELAAQGKYPDISVPEEALTVNNKDRIRQIYQNVCKMVISAVNNKLIELAKKDPNFDCKNDEHYKLAVREVNVYKLRSAELMQEGYRTEWGCPNQVFFKVKQNHKQQDIEFKIQISAIEKSFNHVLEVVSNNPLTIEDENQSIIHNIMQEEIQANIDKEEQRYQKMKKLQRTKSDNPVSQANYFFEKGKIIEKELKESRVKLNMARGKEEIQVKGETALIL